MIKRFNTLNTGEFFVWNKTKYQKISYLNTNNVIIIDGERIGNKSSFCATTEVTPLDAVFSPKKLTLADIKVGAKFLYNGEEYYKSDEKHRSKEGFWCVMSVKTPWIIASMPLVTQVEEK